MVRAPAEELPLGLERREWETRHDGCLVSKILFVGLNRYHFSRGTILRLNLDWSGFVETLVSFISWQDVLS